MIIQAIFNLDGGEIVLILALVLILFDARKLPEMSKGLGLGLLTFRDACKELKDDIDGESSDAGRSLGGIYGKAAAQALTPDNQVAELYNPEVLKKPEPEENRLGAIFERMRRWLVRVARLLVKK